MRFTFTILLIFLKSITSARPIQRPSNAATNRIFPAPSCDYDVTLVPVVSIVSSLPLLAARAEMRGALRHQRAPDRRPAVHARLSRPLIDAVAHLEKPAPSFRVHVVGNRGAPRGDGLAQDGADPLVQAARAL